MRISWNEVRTRAAAFAKSWEGESYEKGEAQTFYNEFFSIFDVKRRNVARFEQHVKKLNNQTGYIDLFWPGVLLAEHKSLGGDLSGAYEQAGKYFDALSDNERPRYILTCDFQRFMLRDLGERTKDEFSLDELPNHVEKFGFILGVQKRIFRDQDPANIKASELVGELHDTLKASGYRGHPLELYLVRIVFCLFADDTGIFDRDIFLELIESRTHADGSDVGSRLSHLFQVLNTSLDERSKTLDEDLARFPYVNGRLFEETLPIPDFDSGMREALLQVCKFDWSDISPAIFGSLFQSVMDPEERRAKGGHYTTEKNILKVIEPLFMEDLRAEFERLKLRKDTRRRADLQQFQQKLEQMRFFDPACGCGNFLVIAYRELRQLELEVLMEVFPKGAVQLGGMDAATLAKVNVDQFCGIEIEEFPVRIAEAAMWMMDHIMNNRLSLEFGQTFLRIPLEVSPNIRQGDALEIDWGEIMPSEECSFVFGNPPFIGQSYQSPQQRQQMRDILDPQGKRAGSLDYVAAWFIRAAKYVQNSRAAIGFVATNSITQGEQVAQMWPILFERYGLVISFAHRTFAWGSDARGKAHVHVVILGLEREAHARTNRPLFNYPDVKGESERTIHSALSPYLIGAGQFANPHIIVAESAAPINGLPTARMGTKPVVGQHYLFAADEKSEYLSEEPLAAPYFRPFIGSREFLQGKQRYILHTKDISLHELAQMPLTSTRIRAVREMRSKSRKAATRKLAEYPTEYEVSTIPTTPFLVLPEVSSERREYVPIGWLEPPVIPSNLVRVVENASLGDLALLTSAMHMAWLRQVGGRLESRYRYSIGLVYNTFPTPPGYASGERKLSKLEPLAQAILDARNQHPQATLADLYDPDLMPPNLRRAHQALDQFVDRLYKRSGFNSEHERIEHLLGLYERMRGPLDADMKNKRVRARRRKK